MNDGITSISREELTDLISRDGTFVLVDALPPMSYAHSHLPGAVNITPEQVDELAERRIPARETAVVVYCANPTCTSSVEVAERLVALGYTDVRHYAGGKKEWLAAGLPLERRESRRRR